MISKYDNSEMEGYIFDSFIYVTEYIYFKVEIFIKWGYSKLKK